MHDDFDGIDAGDGLALETDHYALFVDLWGERPDVHEFRKQPLVLIEDLDAGTQFNVTADDWKQYRQRILAAHTRYPQRPPFRHLAAHLPPSGWQKLLETNTTCALSTSSCTAAVRSCLVCKWPRCAYHDETHIFNLLAPANDLWPRRNAR